MKFDKTYCSQCGGEFGPGDQGFSHCEDHSRPVRMSLEQAQEAGCFDVDEVAAGVPEPVGINGLTEAETSATASVIGVVPRGAKVDAKPCPYCDAPPGHAHSSSCPDGVRAGDPLRSALEKIANMDPHELRADDLGRAAGIARQALGAAGVEAGGNTPYDEGPFTIDHERTAFEAAMREQHPEWAFTPDPVFGYHNERTRCAWEGWQAARARGRPLLGRIVGMQQQ